VHQPFPRNLEARDSVFDCPQRLLVTSHRRRGLQAVVALTASGHVRRTRPKVLAGLPLDSLAFVTAVVDMVVAAEPLERGIREVGPPFARVLHPLPAVKRAALGSTAALGMRGVRTTEPLLATALDAVVPALRDHQMRMRIVFPAVGIMAGVNGQRVRQSLVRRKLLGEGVSQRDLVFRFEITREREVRTQIQAAVRSLEQSAAFQ
jgi:hypothetical protein